MKKLFTTIAAGLITVCLFAQAPQKMSYQAVVRDAGNALITSHAVGMRFSILQGSVSGTVVYTETQTTSTNANGLISIEIGGGAGFDAIDWTNGPYFIKTETDPTGGTNYTAIVGTSQLLSVPYALHSKTAASYSETDPKVGTIISGYSPKWDGLALVTGAIFQDAAGNIGIGTTNPFNKLQIQNGNMVIDRPLSTSILSLGTVAGVTGRIFAGDAGGGSLNTNYNQIKMTANPANTEEILRLHTGADAMSNAGAAAIYFGQFNLADMAAIKAVNEGGQPLNRTAGLSFWTEPAGTGVPLQERMRINGNGNVGIGTTTPATKLDVNGIISAAGGTSTNWNTAYSWGNHAGLYRLITYVPSWTDITAKPTTIAGYGITDAVAITGNQTIAGDKTFTGITTVQTPVNSTDAANKAYVDSKTPIHYIGESYGGGIVFYVYDNGRHGLIAATTDQIAGVVWTNIAFQSTVSNAVRNGINGGLANTERIIIQAGAGIYAAQLCANYNGGNYADWYLPSKYELNLLYLQKVVVGGFADDYYWSSTEFLNTWVWYHDFGNGNQDYDYKYSTHYVRAIRAF